MPEIDTNIDDLDQVYLALDADILDRSKFAHTVTLHGDAALATTQKKYGSKSLHLPGASGDYASIADAPGFDVYADPIWFECWFWPEAVSGVQVISCRNAGEIHLALNGATPYQYMNVSGGLSGGTVTAQAWNHVAWTRYKASWYWFVNGELITSNNDNGAPNDSADPILLGRYSDGSYRFNGYIQGLRFRKLEPLSLTAFTPRTTQYNQRYTDPGVTIVKQYETYRFASVIKTGEYLGTLVSDPGPTATAAAITPNHAPEASELIKDAVARVDGTLVTGTLNTGLIRPAVVGGHVARRT